MELFPLIILLAIFLAELFRDRTPPKKSEEEELGTAMTKLLTKGVRVRIEAEDSKKS